MSASSRSQRSQPAAQSAVKSAVKSAARSRAARALAITHRWFGIAMCLFFAMWFASGAVMLFVPFPALDDIDRYRAMPAVDMSEVSVAPARIAAMPHASNGRLDRLDLLAGRSGPVYVLHRVGGSETAFDARTGSPVSELSRADAGAIAARFGHAPVLRVNGPYRYDQWIVHQRFDPYRPLYRVDLGDAFRTRLYVSARTGEVVQRTTHLERFANYAGSIVHWIYPTILRRYPTLWSDTVWAISLVGIVMAISGISLGILRSWSALRQSRNPRLTPFRKLFRWHHLTGLGVGLFLLTWIFSGWLSVDHGLIFPTGAASTAEQAAFGGKTVEQAAAQVSLPALRTLAGYASIGVNAVGGMAILSGHRAGDGAPATLNVRATALPGVPFAAIAAGVRAAWPGSSAVVSPIAADDSYAHLVYDPLPQSTVRVRLGDARGTWVHVDAVDGRIVGVMDWRRRVYRWLFNGLHTFDFAGLAAHETLRKLLMLPLLCGGFLLSTTGAVLGARRLKRMMFQ